MISGHGILYGTCDCAANQSVHGNIPVTWRVFANPYFGGFPWDDVNETRA